jgi:hypothetical protein
MKVGYESVGPGEGAAAVTHHSSQLRANGYSPAEAYWAIYRPDLDDLRPLTGL